MGGGASIQQTQSQNNLLKLHRKSVRNHFENEFGINACGDTPSIDKEASSSNKNEFSLNPAIFRAKKLFMKPISDKRPIVKNLIIKKQNNCDLLKEMFRRLDPTLTLNSINTFGEVEVAVKYKILEKILLVKIGRLRVLQKSELPGVFDLGVTVDLYSKRDPGKKAQKSTSSKKNTYNPSYQEILTFPLEERSVADSRLCVNVWHRDPVGLHVIGEAVFDICKLDLNVGDITWYQVHHKADETICGSIDVTLVFTEPNMLLVTLHEAHNLKVIKPVITASNTFARISVTGLPSKNETKMNTETQNPIWEETFEFLIHPDEFPRRVIVFNLFSAEVNGNEAKRLGDVQISLTEFNISLSGVKQSYCLHDLRNSSSYARSKWADEGLTLELHEAMRAHATYGYPKSLFKDQHKGRMLVTVNNKKARARAKMILSNGVPNTNSNG